MIIIDDNKEYAQGLKNQLDHPSSKVIPELGSLKEMASWVKSEVKDETQPVLINVESAFIGDDRSTQQGIDILIWLRCAWQIKNPIVLYGFQTTEQLLKQKPENLIMLSEGCYYRRLPDEILKININQLDGVSDLERIKPYLRSALNMEYYRHRFANKWGIRRLSLAYKTIMDKKLIESKSISDSLEEAVAHFIYFGNQDLSISEDINLRIIKSQIKYHQSRLRDKRILYIDDQGKEGWSQALVTVLGIDNQRLIVKSNIGDNLDSEFRAIQLLIANNQPDCILLDLRLLPSKDEKLVDNKNYSGAKLAKKIKKKYPSLPIILFSASNKAENLRIALQTGCETLWTKEGIDDYKGIDFSINNCFRLVKLVSDTCNKFDNLNDRLRFESDLMILELEKRSHAINIDKIKEKNTEWELFEKVNVFIPDTSFLIQTKQEYTVSHYANLFLFIYILKCIYHKPIYIIDDVLLEIIRHSKKVEYSDKDEVGLVEQSRYLLAKLYDWSQQGLITFERPDIINYTKKMRADNSLEIDEAKDENEEDKGFLNNWINNLVSSLLSKEKNAKTKSDDANRVENNLHADETFAKKIPELVGKQKAVFFLCDDWGCRKEVGINVLDSISEEKTKTLKVKNIVSPKDGTQFPVLIAKQDGQIIYKGIWSGEFSNLMDSVRKRILRMSILE